jgi:hypothetical protein
MCIVANFQKSNGDSASSPAAQNLKFERQDWELFRTPEGLQQRAGVSKELLSRLVLKEIADNGLDTGGYITYKALAKKGAYVIEDTGPGIDGTPEVIARLFSINRPMVSTKLLRLPTRGAVGNGLRVVAGAVIASGGRLIVSTRDRQIELRPERDGSTTVVSDKKIKFPVGARVEIHFGPAIPCDEDTLYWVAIASRLAQRGTSYSGKSSPWWYDAAQFHELLDAYGDRPVRELIANLDGCTGGRAGDIVKQAGLGRAVCSNLTLAQVEKLLKVARDSASPVSPKRLGVVGPDAFLDSSDIILAIWGDAESAYGCSYGEARFGAHEPQAVIPFVVEAWVKKTDKDETSLTVCINRTPTTGDIDADHNKRDINIYGGNLEYNTVAQAPKDVEFNIWLNITTPYMPITSDGKAPDLNPFFEEIGTAVSKAIRKAHRPQGRSGVNQKSIVLDNLDAVIAEVGGDGEFRFNERQVFYRLRKIVTDEIKEELKEPNFKAIIDDYESEHGEIPGMYREPRGTIYHPHRGETITLGTLMVEEYERPVWTFNKLVYIEKEGFSEALKDERWGERHDCALISSKGFSTRAARDLVDKLAEHDEPVTVFCVHDADAWGTMIYQTLQKATKARGARKIKIENLGLEPWEAIAMGLEVETLKRGKRYKPVADYVRERDDRDWEEWLQTHRVELNAMTTPEFIEWLDGKMADYAEREQLEDKLIPPPEVLEKELDAGIDAKVRADLTERILREAGFEDQVATSIAAIKKPGAPTLAKGIAGLFKRKLDREWRDHIAAIVARLTTGT